MIKLYMNTNNIKKIVGIGVTIEGTLGIIHSPILPQNIKNYINPHNKCSDILPTKIINKNYPVKV